MVLFLNESHEVSNILSRNILKYCILLTSIIALQGSFNKRHSFNYYLLFINKDWLHMQRGI